MLFYYKDVVLCKLYLIRKEIRMVVACASLTCLVTFSTRPIQLHAIVSAEIILQSLRNVLQAMYLYTAIKSDSTN